MKNDSPQASLVRTVRLQIILSADEMKALDDFRFEHRMPSRAATVRELMRRGLQAGRQRQRASGAVKAQVCWKSVDGMTGPTG
jgi:hypothetical protein